MSAFEIRHGDRTVVVGVDGDGKVRIGDDTFAVTPVGNGLYQVSDGDARWTVAVAGPPGARWLFVDGQVAEVEVATQSRHGAIRQHAAGTRKQGGETRGRGDSHELSSPMPATVVRVLVEAGQRVPRGDTLVMLEAMKMEVPVRAPRDGVVKTIRCTVGELVQPGVQLIELE